MELKEIAVVSGKPGLFKIIKPAKNGVILEAMDGTSARFIAGTSTKVSVLGEISIYTDNGNNVPLEDVFRAVFSKHGKKLEQSSKSSDSELRSFFEGVVPDHDRQRVYISDIKKVITWYGLLLSAGFEEVFAKSPEKAEEEPKKEKKAKKETVAEEAPVKDAPAKKEAKVVTKKEEKPATEKKASAPAAKAAPTKKASK